MMKVGRYRFTVVFILAGILPLLGGTLGLGYLVLYADQPVGYAQYAQGLFGMSVGLMLCGYRSCLYLHQEYGVFVRKMLGFIVREDKFYFSELDEICVDTFTSHNTTSDHGVSREHYTIRFVGRPSPVDITGYIRFNSSVQSPKSFERIKQLAYDLRAASGLKVSFSSKVKKLNDLAE